jgi:hypothetical protein
MSSLLRSVVLKPFQAVQNALEGEKYVVVSLVMAIFHKWITPMKCQCHHILNARIGNCAA